MHTVLLIAACAAALVLDFFVAREFYLAAAMKGWASRKYFFYAFFLTLIGYLLVASLPDRGSASSGSFESRDLPEL
jgi:hypothetical protein